MLQTAVDSAVTTQRWQARSSSEPEVTEAAGTGDCSNATAAVDVLDFHQLVTPQEAVSPRRTTVNPCPAWKRAMDVVGAGVLLVILLPFFLVVAAFIKCALRGPVLFRQRRYGLGGRPFKVWKFRTIEVSTEGGKHRSHVTDLMTNNSTLQKRDDQLQIIPAGRLLRKLGIDELPQLINVLKGEMSLVGPRPDVVPFHKYGSCHRRRFEVVPGITGLWQVNGKNRTTFTTMMQLDLAYVRRRSFWLDVTILLMTIPAIVWD